MAKNHLCKNSYLEVDHEIGHHQNHGRNGNTNTIQKFLEW